MQNSQGKILVIGASGYIGEKLVAALAVKGFNVRAAGRSIDKLRKFSWANLSNVELAAADAMEFFQLKSACSGCSVVYYLVHSMNPQHKDFAAADRQAAQNMVQTAEETKVKRIIYLSGLGEEEAHLSKHLRSRHEVSSILHSGKVPVTTLRAAMIIGKGSASFEILKYLVQRLPVMITPRWVQTESQPIALTNVINYLIGCLKDERTAGQTYDVGGSDVRSYRELIDIYAEEISVRKRWVIPVPILTPTLSSYWVQLVTQYPAYLARPLAEGLRNRLVCRDNRIREIIPQKLLSCREAIREAIKNP